MSTNAPKVALRSWRSQYYSDDVYVSTILSPSTTERSVLQRGYQIFHCRRARESCEEVALPAVIFSWSLLPWFRRIFIPAQSRHDPHCADRWRYSSSNLLPQLRRTTAACRVSEAMSAFVMQLDNDTSGQLHVPQTVHDPTGSASAAAPHTE